MKNNAFLTIVFALLFLGTSILFGIYANVLNNQNKVTTEYLVLNKSFDQCLLVVKERNFVSVKSVSKKFHDLTKINDRITLTESKMTENDLLKILPIGSAAILFGILMIIFSKKINYI